MAAELLLDFHWESIIQLEGYYHSDTIIPIAGGERGGKRRAAEVKQRDHSVSLAAATAAQRAERNLSVKRDLALDLPPCPSLPDGEERPYGSSNRLRIRDHEQESEIYRECIRPPPNRTVHETPSFPPFRCNSESILTGVAPPGGRLKPAAAGKATSSPSSILASSLYGRPPQPPAELSRMLLDMHGQPIVTRSKSMSTGSSLQPEFTAVPKTLESAVRSCVRSLRDRVATPRSRSRQHDQSTDFLLQGGGEESCGSSRLASLPVVSCASADGT